MAHHAKSQRKPKWPKIYTRDYPSGQVAFVVDLGIVNGKREREAFKTQEEADTRAEQARVARVNEGAAAFSLSQEVRVEAAKCLKKLAPYRATAPHQATLTTAVDYYITHVLAFREAPTVRQIVERMLADARGAGRRNKTLNDLSYRLNQFAASFGDRQLGSVSLEELKAWLSAHAISPRNYINFMVKVGQIYRYAIRHGWMDANLVARVERPSTEDKEPGILTVKQAAALLEHAAQFDLLPYVAIGLFAGLRTEELSRMDWPRVKFSERAIIVGSEAAKKRSRRVAEINDTLAAWLGPYVQEEGPVVNPVSFRTRFTALRKAAGIEHWPSNALRHSFGSYHLAAHGDATKTAGLMGHRDPGVLHNHYKALVMPSDAKHFWALRPEGEEGKIVPMPPDGEQVAAEVTATEEASVKARQQSHS